MDYERGLTSQDFNRFLAWLHPDRETAGEQYETLRRGLLQYFQRKACPRADAEELTDETMRRVIGKAQTIAPNYDGEPARYFFGVAHHVRQEYLRRPQPQPAPHRPEPALKKERAQRCREHCLSQLAPPERHLLLAYYQVEPHNKAPRRRALAAELGLTNNNLTVRAHRLRTALHECLERCLAESSAHDIFPL